MVNVTIDTGENVGDVSSVKTMGELVELVKTTIDPVRMITSITLNGKSIEESDWRLPLSIHGAGQLAFETSSKEDFLEERIKGAPDILEQVISSFTAVSEGFRDNDSAQTNEKFASALEDLEAFINWYLAVVEVDSKIDPNYLESFSGLLNEMSAICDGMVRDMMTAKWADVAKAIDLQLVPKLEKIRLTTSEFAGGYKPH